MYAPKRAFNIYSLSLIESSHISKQISGKMRLAIKHTPMYIARNMQSIYDNYDTRITASLACASPRQETPTQEPRNACCVVVLNVNFRVNKPKVVYNILCNQHVDWAI